jgi:hypothetical protein
MRILAAVAAVLLSGCGGSNSSPEAVFKEAKRSAETKDWKSFYGCCDPENARQMLAGLVMAAGFSVMQDKDGEKELKELLHRHGLDAEKQGSMKGDSKPDLAPVKDPAACFGDLMTFCEKKSKGADMNSMLRLQGDLTDVKIDGDKATGTVALKNGPKSPIAFVRLKGSWYLSEGR